MSRVFATSHISSSVITTVATYPGSFFNLITDLGRSVKALAAKVRRHISAAGDFYSVCGT